MASSLLRWATGVGLTGGAVAAAAMIGTASAPVVRADTPDDVVAQAVQDLSQGTAVLDAADTADLSTRQLGGASLLAVFDPNIGTASAASAADTVTDATTPAQLLSEGDADLTDASAVLSGIDLSGQSSDVSSIVTSESGIIGSSLTIQDQIASFQTEIVDTQMQLSGTPGYDLVTQATNGLFTHADQSLLNADDSLLTSSQLLASTISDGSGLTDADMLSGTEALLQLVGADFGALGTTFDAAFTPFLELFAAF
jgi:hypothetical protein